jgi:hypothetical protein
MLTHEIVVIHSSLVPAKKQLCARSVFRKKVIILKDSLSVSGGNQEYRSLSNRKMSSPDKS